MALFLVTLVVETIDDDWSADELAQALNRPSLEVVNAGWRFDAAMDPTLASVQALEVE